MNPRTTTIILTLAVLLAGYFLVFETGLLGTKEQPVDTTDGTPLFDTQKIKTDSVTAVMLKLPGHDGFGLARDDSKNWKQTSPYAWEIDSTRADLLVGILTTLRYYDKQTVDDLTPFDLAQPLYTITLSGEGFTHTLRLGRTTAANRAYLQLAGQPTVYLVDATIHNALSGLTPADLRLDTLKPIEHSRVSTIGFSRDGQVYAAINKNPIGWEFHQPWFGRVNRFAPRDVIDAYNQITIQRFVTDRVEDAADYGFDKPFAIVTYTYSKDEQEAIILGNSADLTGTTRYASRIGAPVVFTISESIAQRLARDIDDLRDPRLATTDRSKLREVRIRQGETPFTIVLSEGTWEFGDESIGFDVDQTAIKQMLDALLGEGAVEYEKTPTDWAADLVVELHAAGKAEPERLELVMEDTHVKVQTDDEGVIRRVPAQRLELLTNGPLVLRNRSVVTIAPASVTAVQIQHNAAADTFGPSPYPAEFRFAKHNGSWDLTGYDRESITHITSALNPLLATGWLSESAFTPHSTLRITLESGREVYLEMDREQLLGRYNGDVFQLDDQTYLTLSADLRDPDVLKINQASDLARIRVANHGFTRSIDGAYASDPDSPNSESHIATMFNTLASLRAVSFVYPDGVKFDRDRPTYRLRYTRADSADTEHTLDIWPPSQNDAIAYIARHDGVYFVINGKDAQALLWSSPEADMNK